MNKMFGKPGVDRIPEVDDGVDLKMPCWEDEQVSVSSYFIY